jgi:hypothetical protein
MALAEVLAIPPEEFAGFLAEPACAPLIKYVENYVQRTQELEGQLATAQNDLLRSKATFGRKKTMPG